MIFSKNGSIIEGDIERWTYERFSVARKDLECRESERPKSLINNNAVNKTSLWKQESPFWIVSDVNTKISWVISFDVEIKTQGTELGDEGSDEEWVFCNNEAVNNVENEKNKISPIK